ncbi:MAG: hypothetical protein WEF86_14830 [Gemmatimonadota bacterium]
MMKPTIDAADLIPGVRLGAARHARAGAPLMRRVSSAACGT